MGKKICMLVTNAVTNDPRVRREARALHEAGFEIVIVGVTSDETGRQEWIEGCEVVRISHPKSLGLLNPWVWCMVLLKGMGLYETVRRLYRSIRDGSPEGRPVSAGAAVPSTSRSESWLRKLRTDLLTVASMIWLNVALFRQALRHRADIYHAHDLDTLLAGCLLKRRTRKPLVYDYHELYTEQFKKGQKTWLWRRYYSMLEGILIKYADLKLTVCDSLGDWITERYGVTSSVTIMNAPPYQVARAERVTRRDSVILYQGLYFPYRGLEQLIESARYLERGRIVLRGYGYWEPHLRSLVHQWNLHDRVEFAAPVPMTELVKAASEADVGVAPFLPVCLNTRYCLPNKLFEYMMAGLAIVGSDLPEMRRIIVGHELGAVFNPESPEEIARVLNEFLADEARLKRAQRSALHWAKSRYNWEVESNKLLQVYASTFGDAYRSPSNGQAQQRTMTGRAPAALQAFHPR